MSESQLEVALAEFIAAYQAARTAKIDGVDWQRLGEAADAVNKLMEEARRLR